MEAPAVDFKGSLSRTWATGLFNKKGVPALPKPLVKDESPWANSQGHQTYCSLLLLEAAAQANEEEANDAEAEGVG